MPKWFPFGRFRRRAPVVPVLRLSGVIGQAGAFRRGLTLQALAGTIEKAFAMPGVRAVALSVNSPGGSPVQSALISRRIRDLSSEKDIPVYAFVEDVAASGGYWLACAADEIYVDESSIVGSIGVVSAGFGFNELIEKHGIERRVHTAGKRKMILDPFRPEQEEDVEALKELQVDIHEAFKAMVRKRRAGKLKAKEEDLFEGAFWSGQKCVDYGLVDGIGHLRPTMRAKFGPGVRLHAAMPKMGWLRRRIGFQGASPPGDSGDDLIARLSPRLVDDLLAAVEERALWQRFGL